ncbi:hypothetical protein [Methylococcus sp. EFPC2]|uniref:hypothetical protein n=1 Tax=Methylococcus sp. EFPC2 TaxID=2812648 RepID=UPI001967C457|nr:hypothetical protein [Methylococcus sp. EFPC2]QSA95759.1 hypothetical protein JWZ97_10910 [Methylococcus sp. EFPC2]
MPEFSLLAATRAIESAMPFVLYRLITLLGGALALLFGALGGAGTFIAFASFSKNPAAFANVGAVLGFAGAALLLHKLRAELLFKVEAGHLTLMAEQLRGANLPAGWAQVDQAKRAAADRFEKGAVFYPLKDTLATALSALPAHYSGFVYRLQANPAGKPLAWITGRIVLADALAILAAHCADNASNNPWISARGGVLRLARQFDRLLRQRLQCLVFELLGFISLYALLLYPIDWAVSDLPVQIGYWRHVFALVFAYSLTATFFQPIATMAMAPAYAQGKEAEPVPTSAERAALAEQSDAIRRILAEAER